MATTAAAAASALLLASCSSSYMYGTPPEEGGLGFPDEGGRDAPSPDAREDSPHHADGSTKKDAALDARPDAPCNFATFVIDLVKNDTTPTAKPSTDLGASCTDDHKQADFASLFP